MRTILSFVLVSIFTAIALVVAQQALPSLPGQEDGRAKTERQKVHSRKYKDYERGPKITEGTGTKRVMPPPNEMVNPDSPVGVTQRLQENVCSSDAIVIGTVQDAQSALTEGESWIFTDYDLSVEDIVKNNALSAISSGDRITVTRPGGTATIKGKQEVALDERFLPLGKGGRYLLLLNYLPDTRAYRTLSSMSVRLTALKAEPLTKEVWVADDDSLFTPTVFVNIVNQSAAGCR